MSLNSITAVFVSELARTARSVMQGIGWRCLRENVRSVAKRCRSVLTAVLMVLFATVARSGIL